MKRILSVFLAFLFICMIGSAGIDGLFASSEEETYEEMPLYDDSDMQDDQEDEDIADDAEDQAENPDDGTDDQPAFEPSEEL